VRTRSNRFDAQSRQRTQGGSAADAHDVRILMHSSLAVTTDGLPLGLAGIKLWTRKKFKGTNALAGRGLTARSTR